METFEQFDRFLARPAFGTFGQDGGLESQIRLVGFPARGVAVQQCQGLAVVAVVAAEGQDAGQPAACPDQFPLVLVRIPAGHLDHLAQVFAGLVELLSPHVEQDDAPNHRQIVRMQREGVDVVLFGVFASPQFLVASGQHQGGLVFGQLALGIAHHLFRFGRFVVFGQQRDQGQPGVGDSWVELERAAQGRLGLLGFPGPRQELAVPQEIGGPIRIGHRLCGQLQGPVELAGPLVELDADPVHQR